MAKVIHWGIIGLGKIARKFAHDLRRVPGAQLTAVASTDLARAQTFAQEWGAEEAFGQYEALLQAKSLDVVYLATPHPQHAQWSRFFLEKGIPVLCEKPLGMNVQEVQSIRQAAQATQTFFMEALWSRFMPSLQQAHRWLQEGRIGTLRHIRADFGFVASPDPAGRAFNKALGGGALLDIGIYPLFLGQWMAGAPIEDLQAVAQFSETEVDAATEMSVRYQNGVTGSYNATFLANTRSEGILYGSTGYIVLPTRFHECQQVMLYSADHQLLETKAFPRTDSFGYTYEIEAVHQALQAGWIEHPDMTHADSLALSRALDWVRERIGLSYTPGDLFSPYDTGA